MHKVSEKPLLALIEAGGVNNTPVPAPSATTDEADVIRQMKLILALTTVKLAGYRVSKPKPKQYKRKGKHKDRVGPTCVCEFADGEVTRMSTFTSLEKLDWDRGVRLSQAAWTARWRARERKQQRPYWVVAPAPPLVVSVQFEQDGVVLARRSDSEFAP
jgi:hypothetical protein